MGSHTYWMHCNKGKLHLERLWMLREILIEPHMKAAAQHGLENMSAGQLHAEKQKITVTLA